MDSAIKYVDSSKFTGTENEKEYIVSSEYFNEQAFEVGNIICIGDGTSNVDENSIFLNIIEVEKVGDNYRINCEDSNVDDVFEQVDVYFEETVQNEYLQEGFDTQALEVL